MISQNAATKPAAVKLKGKTGVLKFIPNTKFDTPTVILRRANINWVNKLIIRSLLTDKLGIPNFIPVIIEYTAPTAANAKLNASSTAMSIADSAIIVVNRINIIQSITTCNYYFL